MLNPTDQKLLKSDHFILSASKTKEKKVLFAFVVIQSIVLFGALLVIGFQAWKIDRLIKNNNRLSAYAEECVEWASYQPEWYNSNAIKMLQNAIRKNAKAMDAFDVNDISGWFPSPSTERR